MSNCMAFSHSQFILWLWRPSIFLLLVEVPLITSHALIMQRALGHFKSTLQTWIHWPSSQDFSLPLFPIPIKGTTIHTKDKVWARTPECCLHRSHLFLVYSSAFQLGDAWNVWRRFWLSHWGTGGRQHPVGRGQRCFETSDNAQDSLLQQRIIPLKVLVTLRLRKLGVEWRVSNLPKLAL